MSRALNDADRILADSRDQIMGLRRSGAELLDLHSAMEEVGQALATDARVRFEFRVIGAPREIREAIRGELMALVTEALRNAFRHSRARTIEVVIEYTAWCLGISIGDDGVGLDEATKQHGRPGHAGLRGMQERARIIGRTLELRAAQPQGTVIVVRLAARKAYVRRWRWLFARR